MLIAVKGNAPMPQDNEGYILYPAGYPKDKIRRIHSRKSHSGPNHAFMYKGETSNSRQPTCAKLPKKTPIASNEHDISFKTFDASYVLTNKSGKVAVSYTHLDVYKRQIKQQNDHIAKLDAKIAEHELENENFKFARSMLYSGQSYFPKRKGVM